MADSTTTTIVAFSPRPKRALKPTVQDAHAALLERLAAVSPHVINPLLVAAADDLDLRADTLRCHLRAVRDFVIAFLQDTADHSATMQPNHRCVEAAFADLIGDACGPISRAADAQREVNSRREG